MVAFNGAARRGCEALLLLLRARGCCAAGGRVFRVQIRMRIARMRRIRTRRGAPRPCVPACIRTASFTFALIAPRAMSLSLFCFCLCSGALLFRRAYVWGLRVSFVLAGRSAPFRCSLSIPLPLGRSSSSFSAARFYLFCSISESWITLVLTLAWDRGEKDDADGRVSLHFYGAQQAQPRVYWVWEPARGGGACPRAA